MKVLCLGEIVGKAGLYALKMGLPQIEADLVIANGEGTTNGFGIGEGHARYLGRLGVSAITGGDKLYYKKDLIPVLETKAPILKPLNLPYGSPGRTRLVLKTKDNPHLVLLSLLGQTFFRKPANNPFTAIDFALKKAKEISQLIMVDFHAQASSETQLMRHHLAGKVSILVGSGCKTLTRDAQIYQGTAYISDTGMCGATGGIGGFDPEAEIEKYRYGVPTKSQDCWKDIELQGVLITLDSKGIPTDIETIRLPIPTPEAEV